MEPVHNSGQSITGAYEGWFSNPDGTFSILYGYYNRNLKQDLDIPIGANNRIEPGGPDQGQPTHFLPGRQWGVFTVNVPKDFATKKVTWTISANGSTTQIPAGLDPLWELAPFKDATGNTPPYVGFSQSGPFAQGPRIIVATMSTPPGTAMPITAWTADDAVRPPGAPQNRLPPVIVTWSKYRGPGAVSFLPARAGAATADFPAPPGATFTGKASATATFSEPGEYILRVVGNDWSGEGGGGFQCCWTNAQIKVTVK
jgi:hypothetical protein